MIVRSDEYSTVYKLKNKYLEIDFIDLVCKITSTFPETIMKKNNLGVNDKIKEVFKKKEVQNYNFVIIPNFYCNLNCVYCFEKSFKKQHDLTKNIDSIPKILDYIKSIVCESEFSITLMGGEPLLKRNYTFWNELLERFDKMFGKEKYDIYVVTNGLGVELYNELFSSREVRYQITLDGDKDIHNARRIDKSNNDSYTKILNNIVEIQNQNKVVDLRVNIDKDNYKSLRKINKVLLELDTSLIKPYIYPVTYGNESADYLKEEELFYYVLEEIKDLDSIVFQLDFHGIRIVNQILHNKLPKPKIEFCGVSGSQHVITPNGTVSSCWWAVSIQNFLIGSLDRDQVFEENKAKLSYRNILEMERCKTCKFRFLCGGGCAFKEFEMDKSFDKGKCSSFEKMINYYVEFLDERDFFE